MALGSFSSSFEPGEIVCHGVHAALLRFRNADFGHAASDVLAAAVSAGNRLFSVLTIGEKHIEALVAVVANKIIAGHIPILLLLLKTRF